MKERFILQQHLPLAHMISGALDFCESMLLRSDMLYPFALICTNNEIHSIFANDEGQLAHGAMIESLQAQIQAHKNIEPRYASVLVYAADIKQASIPDTDALVLTITDSQGHNTIALYPFTRVNSGIKISQPCTCDFPD
jgi:hypothetical protein